MILFPTTALTELSDWWEVVISMKEVWKSVSLVSGALSVIVVGVAMMLGQHVVMLVTPEQVRSLHIVIHVLCLLTKEYLLFIDDRSIHTHQLLFWSLQ